MRRNDQVHLILALHNHQPVGNLPQVFEDSFEKAYRPFVEVVSHYPEIKVTLHYSGILLEWMENYRPEFLEKLCQLVSRGQVEIMGGAYYEPILPIIPDEDKIGQIRKLSRHVKDLLGTVPQGMWLAERIWEPHLARPIASAGLRYITVDDAHFHEVGYQDLLHYYLTEEEGWELCVFPISEKLRYLIPFRPVEEVISFLQKQRGRREGSLLVLADDGEKFGAWPETHQAVYRERWLEKFFTALKQNRDWLRPVTFSDFMEKEPPEGPVYIPAASYREMKQWSRGYWRNFLNRYPESNRMHKKMLSVRRRVNRLSPGNAREKAFRHLWAGQCNCAYWHGVFGGLYLNFLRSAIWENLLKAEEIAESSMHRKDKWLETRIRDLDYDGEKEVALVSDRFSLVFSPYRGGSLWELSWRPSAVNFLDTLTRRPEKYHRDLVEQELAPSLKRAGKGEDSENNREGESVKTIHHRQGAKEEGLEKYLQYDNYQRGGLIEHFFPYEEVSLDEFKEGSYRDRADLLLRPATLEVRRSKDRENSHVSLIFRRRTEKGEFPMMLKKEVILEAGSDKLQVSYSLQNCGENRLEGRLGVEMNLSFLSGYGEDRFYRIPGRRLESGHMASEGLEEEVEKLQMFDGWRNLSLDFHFSHPVLLWRFPIETVSQSEEGMERVYQQSLVLTQWKIKLESGESSEFQLSMGLRSNPGIFQEPAGVTAEGVVE